LHQKIIFLNKNVQRTVVRWTFLATTS